MVYNFKDNKNLIKKTAKRYHISMNEARRDFVRTQRLRYIHKSDGVMFMTRTSVVEYSRHILEAAAKRYNL